MPQARAGSKFVIQADWCSAIGCVAYTPCIWLTVYCVPQLAVPATRNFGRATGMSLAYFTAGSPSVYFNICIGAGGQLTSDDVQFSAELLNKHTLRLQRTGDIAADDSATCVFVAHSAEFDLHASKSVNSIALTAGGLGASASVDGRLYVWNALNGRTQTELKGHLMEVYTCAFFPSGMVLAAAGSDTIVRIWSVENEQPVRELKGHTQGVMGLCILGAGKMIGSCSRDGSVIRWSVGDARVEATLEPEIGPLSCVDCFESDSDYIGAVGSFRHGKFVLFRWGDMKQFTRAEVDTPVTSIKFLSATLLAVGTECGSVFLYTMAAEKICLSASRTDGRGSVNGFCFCDNRLLAVFDDGTACMWSKDQLTTVTSPNAPETGLPAPLVELSGPDCVGVKSVAAATHRVLTAAKDGLIRVYGMQYVR